MLAMIAAAMFTLALIFQLTGFALGVITAAAFVTAGLLCIALHLSGVGASSRTFSRRR